MSDKTEADCPKCIHYSLPKHCNAWIESIQFMIDFDTPSFCQHYVPRACGNCLFHPKSGHCQGCEHQSHWQPRPVVKEKQTCGACGRYLDQPFHGYEGVCITKGGRGGTTKGYYCKGFIEKSCSVCGHFHAEPRDIYEGYCDSPDDPNFWGEFGKGVAGVLKSNGNKCPRFTPRAAPITTITIGEKLVICPQCINYENGQIKCKKEFYQSALSCGFYEKSTPPPACARCGTTNKMMDYDIIIQDEPHRNVRICWPCSRAMPKRDKQGKELGMWSQQYREETAAGRPWACDKSKCEYCGEGIYINVPHSCKYLNAPAAAPVGANTQKIITTKKEQEGTTLKLEMEVRNMFKCAQCGYEDETRKKVVYCPRCGAGVEKKDDTAAVAYRLLQADCRDLQNCIEKLQREKGDLAAKVEKLDIEIGREKCDYNDVVTQLNAANEQIASLRRRGIPRKCRNCHLRPKEGQCKFLGIRWGLRGFLGMTYCDSAERADTAFRKKKEKKAPRYCKQCHYFDNCVDSNSIFHECAINNKKEKKKHPAKPAALWRLKRKVARLEKKQNKQGRRERLEKKLQILEGAA